MTKELFFDTVRRWVKKDVERMLANIPALDGQDGNINFPLALCILVYMESLGGYLLGKKIDYETQVKTYIEQCFDAPEKYNPTLLRALFRNGLTHEYFPGGGISRDNADNPMYRTSHDGEEIVVLDAELLARDFLKSLDTFFTKLTDTNYVSRRSQIKKYHESQMKLHKKIIDCLPTHPVSLVPINLSAYAHQPISGASIPRGPVKMIPWKKVNKPATPPTKTKTSSSTSPDHTTTLEPR